MSATDTTWLDQLFKFPGGTFAVTMADADRVENSADIVQAYNIIYSGTLTATRTITFPLPTSDALSYNRTIKNNTSGSHNLTITDSGGTTATVSAGATARLIFEPAGVRIW